MKRKKKGVVRVGDCTGCHNRSQDPNDRPCNLCFRATNKPRETRDKNGNYIERYGDYYLIIDMKSMPNLVKIWATGDYRWRSRTR